MLLILTACQSLFASDEAPETTRRAAQETLHATLDIRKEISVLPTQGGTLPGLNTTQTPTAVLIFDALQQEQVEPESGVVPTPLPDPLRFVFPTPGPEPISAWRPPLYPIPWAPTQVDHFYFVRPIAADEVNWPLPNYRYGGEFFDEVVHTGVDIPAERHTPVLAAGPGRVVWTGYGLYSGWNNLDDPYGLAVAIRHDFGYKGNTLYTVYGHLDQIDVAIGRHVQAGEVLGLVGATGRVTGPHLHFEVRLGENTFFNTQNPELWLAPPQGWGILAGRVMDTSGHIIPQQEVIITSLAAKQTWIARTYGEGAVNSDAYYQENLVVGDLPAGHYTVWIDFAGVEAEQEIEIRPGLVSYFYFWGRDGFEVTLPPLPGAEFTPQPAASEIAEKP